MKIAIIVYCLRGGGAERVCSYLADGLVEKGHEVTLITELSPDSDQYILDPRVSRRVIGTPGASPDDYRRKRGSMLGRLWRLTQKVMRLRRVFTRLKPDVVISFMTRSNNMALMAGAGLPIRTVICERNDPRLNKEPAIDRRLRARLYRHADLLIAQTDTMGCVARDLFGVKDTLTIPNPCVTPAPRGIPGLADVPDDYILAMGRLAPQKGFDVLIRAYAASRAKSSIALVIAGQGGHGDWYLSIAEEEGVASQVHFVGHVDDPYPLLKNCRMFVLSSHYEGFPNVLLESMSLGRPVISTILPSGAHDMIEHGVNGLLVPTKDVDALAAAIDVLADDRDAAEAMGARAPAAVAQFSLPVVLGKWEEAAATVLRGAVRAA